MTVEARLNSQIIVPGYDYLNFEYFLRKLVESPNETYQALSLVSQILPHDTLGVLEDLDPNDPPTSTELVIGEKTTINGKDCWYCGEYSGSNSEYQGKKMYCYIEPPKDTSEGCGYTWNEIPTSHDGFIVPSFDVLVNVCENLGSFFNNNENPIIESCYESGMVDSFCTFWSTTETNSCRIEDRSMTEGVRKTYNACTQEESCAVIGEIPEDIAAILTEDDIHQC